MMTSRRQPIESAGCDSTSSGFEFPTAQVPSTQADRSHTSHFPIEHSEDDATSIKREPQSTNTNNFSTADLDSQNDSSFSSEKGPDSTFHPHVLGGPPPYSLPLSTNHVLNYRQAVAGPVPAPLPFHPQQLALESIAPHSHHPVSIFGTKTLRELALRLDPDMAPASNWKVMAECMNFSNLEIMNFERERSPTIAVIKAWSLTPMENRCLPTIADFMNILNIDVARPDVVTDIPELIMKDVQRHQSALRRNQSSEPALNEMYMRMSSSVSPPPTAYASSAYSPGSFTSYGAQQMATYTFSSSNVLNTAFEEKPVAPNSSRPVQVQEVEQSAPEQLYDAFVLCNMADKDFVIKQFLPKVEQEGKLKLCFADRDVPAGNLAFYQHMNYMFQRSRKLVVILSDEFFQSQEHDWQSNLAISQDPASRKQRIIPVKYKKLNSRNIFDHLGCCDLTRTMQESWFWDKIINGIKAKA